MAKRTLRPVVLALVLLPVRLLPQVRVLQELRAARTLGKPAGRTSDLQVGCCCYSLHSDLVVDSTLLSV